MSAWMKIETAPRDGTRLLLWPRRTQSEKRIAIGYWHKSAIGAGRWTGPEAPVAPTYWQPFPLLPPSPRPTQESDVGEDEFCKRFVAEMMRTVAPRTTFGEEGLISDYAAAVAPAYFEDLATREEGPEECARADVSYWETT